MTTISFVLAVIADGNLREEMYRKCPADDVEYIANEVLLPQQSFYGLECNTRIFFTKLVTLLQKAGFKQNIADPSFLRRRTETEYFTKSGNDDDCFTIDNINAKEEKLEELK